ncbi:hypothetical protein [Vibrio sp. SCSIO 43136]|uniref:hypothetical protein n=1 Tax=Vibrio sp. SCSIO 43136 TaxID=2819101 RepID=UPI002075E3F2|nr:hypothetical protein [Vibrio sp. SCSIO 43136]USD65054.1 hypothetical protein J4N39_13470 [Vibrio sp. SCSIO 43136]
MKNITKQWRGRLILLSLIALFALPAGIAKLFLSMNWYQTGVTNKGVLVEPATYWKDFGLEANQSNLWQLALVLPEQCDSDCQQQVHLLGQSHQALGKYQARVSPTLLTTVDSKAHFELQTLPVNQAFIDRIDALSYVIVDPRGQIVMTYPYVANASQVAQTKAMLADLRKLLKLSRVG